MTIKPHQLHENDMRKTTIVLSAALLIFTLVGLSHAGSDTIKESFNVSPGGTLIVDSDAGSIEVESHDSNTVEVEVYRKGSDIDDFTVRFEQEGDDVRIRGDKESGWGNFSLQVKYVIRVPRSYNTELNTGGGSIAIEKLSGSVEAFTSGGSIKLGEIEGDVEVKTSGGSIRVEDVAGNIEAHTSGGSIKAKLSKQLTEDCKLTTSGGSIAVHLAPSMAVELNASTSGGRVSSEFDVDGSAKKTRIRGSINGGGPELTLRTSGGSVSVKEL